MSSRPFFPFGWKCNVPNLKIRHPYLIISGVLLTHLFLIVLPSINLEFAFVDAAHYFKSGNQHLLDQYFKYQANTLGQPYLGWLLSSLLPNLDMLFVLRLLSASGIVFLGFGLVNINKFLGRKDDSEILLLVLLNPLVWVFSARATADFLPAAMGIFAISIVFISRPTVPRSIVSGILLGIAAVLKYHVICLSIILFAFMWGRKEDKSVIRAFFIVSAISLLLPIAYVITAHRFFGFWITPPPYQSVHGLKLSGLANNFFLYVGYLVMLCAPSSLIFPKLREGLNKYWRYFLPAAVCVFFIGYFGFQDGGELNLGPLDRFFTNQGMVSGALLVLSLTCLSLIWSFLSMKSVDKFYKRLGISIGTVIFVLSLSRPAQRYLLMVIPFFILLLPRIVISNKLILRASVIAYLIINSFIAYSQWCTGTAAENMALSIRKAGLIEVTDPGAIEAHVGNQFNINPPSHALYTVVAGNDPSAIINSQSGISSLKKSFSLVKLKQ